MDDLQLFDAELERLVVGNAVLVGDQHATALAGLIAPEVFVTLRPVAQICVDLARAHGAFDAVMVRRSMVDQGWPTTGAHDLLVQCMTAAAGSITQIPWLMSKLQDLADLRVVVSRCQEIEANCRELKLEDAMRGVSRMGDGLGKAFSPVSDVRAVVAGLSQKREIKGVSTTFPDVDQSNVYRGYSAGETSVVLARRGTGKTAFVGGSVVDLCEANVPVMVVVLEMGQEAFVRRLAMHLCGYASHKQAFDAHDEEVWELALDQIAWWPLRIYDPKDYTRGYSVRTICDRIMVEHRANPLGVVFVDYVQKARPDGRNLNYFERHMEVSATFAECAKSAQLPVVLMAQCNDDSETGSFRVRGAEAYEEDASMMIEVRRNAEHGDCLRVTKNRHGKAPFKAPIHFDERYVRFRPGARIAPAAIEQDARYGA